MVLTANLTYVTVQTLPLDRILCAEVALSSWGVLKRLQEFAQLSNPPILKSNECAWLKIGLIPRSPQNGWSIFRQCWVNSRICACCKPHIFHWISRSLLNVEYFFITLKHQYKNVLLLCRLCISERSCDNWQSWSWRVWYYGRDSHTVSTPSVCFHLCDHQCKCRRSSEGQGTYGRVFAK